jgi:hypothetical protein
MAIRTRYQTHADVLPEARSRALAGLSPDAALARDTQLGSGVGDAAGPGPLEAPHAGGTAADLGIRTNNREGNARAGQDFRAFMGGDGLEHHVYAGGQDVRVKPRGTEESRLAQFKTAVAARQGGPAPNTGQNPPPGPQDTSGQQQGGYRDTVNRPPSQSTDLSAVAALPPDQQEALMQLASAAAQQRGRNAANPELDLVRRPSTLKRM